MKKIDTYEGKRIHYAEFTVKDTEAQDSYLYKGFS